VFPHIRPKRHIIIIIGFVIVLRLVLPIIYVVMTVINNNIREDYVTACQTINVNGTKVKTQQRASG
jgi:hypothetical protein